MKKSLLFIFGIFIVTNSLFGQLYTFSTTTASYTQITGTDVFSSGDNNSISASINIGFTFTLGCINYTQLQICTEGWIGFGGGMTSNSNNDLTGSAQRPIIAPLWDNLRVSGSNSARIRYVLSGTAPNRVFTIEFYRMRWNESAGGNNDRMMSFKVNLYETSNIVEFNYQREGDTESGTSASIGIAGPTSGQYISVSNAAVSSTVTEFNVTTKPVNDVVYRFTPGALLGCSGAPATGTVSASSSSVTCGSPPVNFTLSGATTGCGISYQWQSSPNNLTWTNIVGATSTTYSATILTTTYFRCVTTCSNSGISANSNSVLVSFTGCTGTPTPGTASTTAGSTTCASSSKTFTLTGASAGCGITYQWQYSNDNSVWFNIPGATSTTYTGNILGLTYIRCVIFCSGSGLNSTSNVVTVSSTATPPANDLPCYAIDLTLGAPSSGNNECSGSSFEPAAGSCWTGGSVNTVWYRIVVPASGNLRIRTIIQSGGTILQRTQIALYSGTCSSLTQIACNVSAPICGNYTPSNSELFVTGLTPGAAYYLSVDGWNSLTGSFAVLAIDGNLNFPLVQGQDCGFSYPLCNATTTVGNPGYQAIGGQCDHNGSGNCTGGEANSVWYTIKINPLLVGSTTLEFDIVPNDYGNPNPITGINNPGYSTPGDESDYDFILWKTAGTGSTNCAAINAGGVAPAACNYNALGLSGTTNSGNSPAAYPGFNGSYEVAPTVVANDEFILVIQNYTNSTSGFTVQFPALSPVIYDLPTIVYWSGGNFDNDFNAVKNWSGCNSPTCAISAVVTAASSNLPDLTTGTYSVNNITINAGSSLTIRNGVTLQVCGNFTNNGSLICEPGSTVSFIGTGTQTISGAFENTDGFFNLTINKLTGSVVLVNNIDVDGNFLTNNNTSILNTAGFRVRVGGNFTNANGNSTFSNTGTTGNLTFNGTGAQTYNQGNSQLDLNFVVMNKTAGVLTLLSDMFIKSTTGTLTLTNGKITTNAFRVDVVNNAPNCVSTGNTLSYVNGNLYRAINTLGSYDFPVGTATLYERANVNFTAATTITQLRARFDPWAGAPNTLGLPDCAGTATYNIPSQDMGIWTITAFANPTSGTYDITLYSTGATNTAGAVGWTVQKAADTFSPWGLNGTCAFSTVSVIRRTGLIGFSAFGVAQSSTPLPIELTNFQGYRQGTINYLKWTTASEINSDYFAIERSRNGKDFETIETIQAQGNSNQPVDYMTSDVGQINSINYYRLKFYDLDGSFEYSKIISLTSEISSDLEISKVYPNPGSTELFFNYSVLRSTNLTISMIDNLGRTIWSTDENVEGNGVYSINTSDFSNGFYILKIKSDDGYQEVFHWVKK